MKIFERNHLPFKTIFNSMMIFIMCLACSKKEYQIPSVGEQIPYEDSIQTTFEENLKNSPYTLFQQVWTKAKLNEIAPAHQGKDPRYTILVVTNEGMEKAGWNSNKISQTDPILLRKTFLAHILTNYYNQNEVQAVEGNLQLTSRYRYQDLFIQPVIDLDASKPNLILNQDTLIPYQFMIALGKNSESWLINGQNMGKIKGIEGKDHYLFPINQVIMPPEKTAWEMIQSNPDFSMYSGIIRYTDSLYRELFKKANNVYPENGTADMKPFIRNSPLKYHQTTAVNSKGFKFTYTLDTWFIPTNQAFKAAGFSSLEDLKKLNISHGLPYSEYKKPSGSTGFYHIIGEFATDSLLDYHHNWGMRYFNSNNINHFRNTTLFFSNVLNNDLNNYPLYFKVIKSFESGRLMYHKSSYYINPFLFTPNEMSFKDDPSKKATFLQKDIYTVNGIINSVDKLLIPKDFKK